MINLLPPNTRREYAAARRNTKLRHYVVVLLVLLVLCLEITGYGLISLKANKTQAEATKTINQAQVDSLKKTSTEATSVASGINTVGKLLNQKIDFADMITNIGKSTPSGAYLTNLQLAVQDISKQPLVLVFRVNSQKTAAVLRNNLSSSDVFKQVDIESVIKQDTSSSDTAAQTNYPFEATLNAQLKPVSGEQK